MMRRCLPLLAMLLVSSPLAAANGLDLNINDKAVRVTVEFDLSNNLLVDASLLHHEDKGDVAGAGLHLTGAATGGPNPLRAGLGGRLMAVDAKVGGEDDGVALPIGGFVNYTIPGYDRFVIGGSLYYAPDVLSFGDMTKYFEYNAWAGYSVLRQGQIYLGARRVRSSFKDSPGVTFDTGLHVGLRLRF